MSSTIVDDVGAVTPRWLTSVLGGAGVDAAVRAVTVEPVGTGQMGSCYRLRIEYARERPPASS